MNYIKAIKNAEITIHNGETVEVSDASMPLAEFNASKSMHIKGDDETTIIPYHAVVSVTVTTQTESVTKADPYGCEDTAEECVIDQSKMCESCLG